MAKSKLQKKKDNVRSKYWKTKADGAWGAVIHQSECCAVDNADCAGNLEAHHLISRGRVTLRHLPINGILLCSNHHKFSKYLSAHMAPLAFADWLDEFRPEEAQWCRDNKWKVATEKPDYKEAYEKLSAILQQCQ